MEANNTNTTAPNSAPELAAPQENHEKNYILAVALSFLVGSLGVDRFYLGYVATGILKLITFGGLGIWSLIDLVLIAFGKLKAKNNKLPLEAYTKYAQPFKMVATILVVINVLFLVGTIALVGFVTYQGLNMRKDNLTFLNAQAVSNEIGTYIANENTIPDDLATVSPGYDVSNLTYTKDSDTSFTFCATYKSAGTATMGEPDTYSTETYSDNQTLYISATHEAGANCRTITPNLQKDIPQSATTTPAPSTNTAATYAETGCGIDGVMSPSTVVVGSLSRSSNSTSFTFKTTGRNGGSTYNVSADAHIFDSNCAPLSASTIVNGDGALVFLKADPTSSSLVTGQSLSVGVFVKQP
jgi:TM2 domain-containing membrane protein YozV